MYSRKSWGGAVDPFILVKFVKPDNLPEDRDPIVSLVIFEWNDRPLIGAVETGSSDPQVGLHHSIRRAGTETDSCDRNYTYVTRLQGTRTTAQTAS